MTIREYEDECFNEATFEFNESEFRLVPWACSSCVDAVERGDPLGEGHGGCSAMWLDQEPLDIELIGGTWKALIQA
jgi:hypothetical protein